MSNGSRLNKYISESGFCSRREADTLIEQGLVRVNNEIGNFGTIVKPSDKVYVDDKLINSDKKQVYIAFNKPVGVTCTTDKKDPTNIVDYIGYPERIFPIGRLDKDSEGLIFLTNDGDIVNRILRAGNAHEKEYTVTVDHRIDDAFIKKMSEGVRIHKTVTLPCNVRKLKPNAFSIILTQGLNRQIRLMCEALGYEVVALKRTRIMNISLKGIQVGNYRKFTSRELEHILEMTKNSSKTEEASLIGGQTGKKQNKKNPSVRYAKKVKQQQENKDNRQSKDNKNGKNTTSHYKKKKSPIRNKMKKKK